MLTLTAGGAVSTGAFKSQHQTDTCVWRSRGTHLGSPTPCSKAAGRGVGAAWGVWGGDRGPPSHSEKWEEATAGHNTAPRPLGLRASGLLVCHTRDFTLSRDSRRRPGSTCPPCAHCWGSRGKRPRPPGRDRDEHGGGRRPGRREGIFPTPRPHGTTGQTRAAAGTARPPSLMNRWGGGGRGCDQSQCDPSPA